MAIRPYFKVKKTKKERHTAMDMPRIQIKLDLHHQSAK